MSVKDYYYKHFNELNPEKQFHFATRMKNYFKIHDFDDYLKDNQPDTDLTVILADNDYSKVNNYAARRLYFEKYSNLYGIEAALFRIHHLLKEYDIDIREQFSNLYSIDELYSLSDELLNDYDALRVLSTWAINTIYLTEELFPRNIDVVEKLSKWILNQDERAFEPTLYVYFCTHIIICESSFYTKSIKKSLNLSLFRPLLERCSRVIEENIDTISLDAAIEFLVCCNLLDEEYLELKQKIKEICNDYKKSSPYLINYRRSRDPNSYFHTLNGAEHINVLYIMSGLDT